MRKNLRQLEGLEENTLKKKPPSIIYNPSLWACLAASGTITDAMVVQKGYGGN
jgi:hypothetical protein